MLVTEGPDLESNTTPLCGGCPGGINVADLKTEYTDIRDRIHKVEHTVVPVEDKAAREQIIEELFYALTRTGRKVPV